MDKQMISRITLAFDRFITSVGGNLDPRGGCNRDRLALLQFWRDINSLNTDMDSDLHIEDCMRKILQDKLTSLDFKDYKPKFKQYDSNGNLLPHDYKSPKNDEIDNSQVEYLKSITRRKKQK